MQRTGLLLAGAALAALLTGCATAPPDTHDADVQAIKDTETAWNRDVKDADKWASYYSEDASLLIPNAPLLSGRAQILAGIKPMTADPNFSLSFHAAKVDVAKSGELGYTQGPYTLTLTDPQTRKLVTDKGKYVTVYRKQADGNWKAVSDIVNSDLPLPPASAAK